MHCWPSLWGSLTKISYATCHCACGQTLQPPASPGSAAGVLALSRTTQPLALLALALRLLAPLPSDGGVSAPLPGPLPPPVLPLACLHTSRSVAAYVSTSIDISAALVGGLLALPGSQYAKSAGGSANLKTSRLLRAIQTFRSAVPGRKSPAKFHFQLPETPAQHDSMQPLHHPFCPGPFGIGPHCWGIAAEACRRLLASLHVPTLGDMKCSFRLLSSLLRVLPSTSKRFSTMQSSLTQPALLPAAARRQWRATSAACGPRRSAIGPQLCNGLGSKQRQPRLAAAASTAATEAAAEAAQPGSSSQRKELPKNFDPAASEEALYQW